MTRLPHFGSPKRIATAPPAHHCGVERMQHLPRCASPDSDRTPMTPPCTIDILPRLPHFASPKRIATAPPEHPLVTSRKYLACHTLRALSG
eukprot:2472657-Pyramimonas_sp.AAC.1